MGGAVWTSFLAAFVLALFTAFAYAELVSKYPRAAGAALGRAGALLAVGAVLWAVNRLAEGQRTIFA